MSRSVHTTALLIAKLDADQVRAAEMQIEGCSAAEIGEELGVHSRTIRRWRAKPEFVALVTSGLKPGLDAARARIDCLREAAIDCVESVLRDETARPEVRLKAAEMVFERSGLTPRPDANESSEPLSPAAALLMAVDHAEALPPELRDAVRSAVAGGS